MEISSKKRFEKQLAKLPKKIQHRFIERLGFLVENKESILLKIHTLKGSGYSLQSMNITADYRALFIISENVITFYEIGTHSDLCE